MSQKKAAILDVGKFDATGRPVGWEFDRNVRINEKEDGSWTMGGYSETELREIAEKAAAETGEEVEAAAPKEKPIEQKPAPTVFTFKASIMGAQAVKPAKLRVHKKLTLLSPDIDELAAIDKLLEQDVEVMIIKPNSGMTADEFFEHYREKFESDDAEAHEGEEKKDAAAEEPEEEKTGELDLDGEADPEPDPAPDPEPDPDPKPDPAPDPGPADPEPDPPAEEPAEAPKVCPKCQSSVVVNNDDPTQLICASETCGEVFTNPDAEIEEFD